MLLEVDRLDYGVLEKLAREDVLVVFVRNFIDLEISGKLADPIIGHGFQKYLNAPSIGRIGMAFYEAENQAPLMAGYFESVFENIDELRRRCAPYVSPIDLLRCVLDEVWPAGHDFSRLFSSGW